MKVINTYEVEPTASGSRVRHALEISGPLTRITKLIRLDRVYQGWLDKEVGKMIEMASARSGGHPIEGGARA